MKVFMWLRDELGLLNKLIRPILPLTGGFGAWIIARACGADAQTAKAAAVAIGASAIGASFWHYGAANRMYARKHERIEFQDPDILKLMGLATFWFSINVAQSMLPEACTYICTFNLVVIAAYSEKLASDWTTKNLTMAIVSATPIIIGWQAGKFRHPMVPWTIALTMLVHLAHEIVKDVRDRKANEGIRVTLPMVITNEGALQVAGAALLVATVLPLFLLRFTGTPIQRDMIIFSMTVFLLTAMWLIIRKQQIGVCKNLMKLGLCFTIAALI